MGIILVAPAVVTPIAVGAGASAGATAATFAAKLLATTAISTALSFAASALQPKASLAGGETGGRMVAVSNTGTDPRIVILGTFRDAGSLIWHKEHEGHKVKVTQVIQICDLPVDGYLNEIVDGEVEVLVPNDTQTVPGHAGPGFSEGDTPAVDSLDWVPLVGQGAHGDIWRQSPAGPNGPLWKKRGRKWAELTGATFHDLPSSNPTTGLGSNGDVAINRSTGNVYIKRGGFWRLKATVAGAGDSPRFIENSGEPGDTSRFLHYENGDRRWRWHFKVRYYDGTQTTADSFAQAISEGEWGSTMVGNSRAYKVVTQRYYPNIYTGAFPVQTASIVRGVKVYDPRLPATGSNVNWYGTTVKSDQIAWTENGALLAAFIKCWPELPGSVPYSEIDEAELIASANVADQTIVNPDTTTEIRYSINGMVMSTESRDSVEEALEVAIGGHIYRRGGKWVIWAGRARATTASFDATNIVGTDYDYQPGAGLRDRKNRVIGTYFSPAQNYTQVSMSPHQNATYISEDGGQQLTESIHFRFAAKTRFTPRRLAKIWLRQRRAEANTLSLKLDVEALDLSPLDVIELTEPFIGFSLTRFVVAALDSPFLSIGGSTGGGEVPAVQCTLFGYDPNTWDAPTENPTEVGATLPGIRDLTSVDPPSSLTVDLVSRTQSVDIQGRLLVNVSVLVGRSPDLRAVEYELQYRMSPENFTVSPYTTLFGDGSSYTADREWASVTKVPPAEADPFRMKIKGLYDGALYDFRVRAINSAGSSSDSYTDDDWTRQIDAQILTTGFLSVKGLPASLSLSENLFSNPNFNQGPLPGGTSPLGWEYESAASGSTVWEATVGRYGFGWTKISIVSDTRRIRQRELIPVVPGERYLYRYWCKLTGAISNFKALINVQYYTETESFVSTSTIVNIEFSTSDWVRLRKAFTVPTDDTIRFARFQAVIQQPAVPTGNFDVLIDGTKGARVFGGRSSLLATAQNLNNGGGADGTVWTNIRRVSAGTPGDPVSLSCDFYARIGDEGLGNPVQLEVRAVRWDADGVSNLTEVMAPVQLGDTFGPATTGAWDSWRFYRVPAFDSTEARGEFVYGFQFRTDRVNGKAAVRYRALSWRIEDETGTP